MTWLYAGMTMVAVVGWPLLLAGSLPQPLTMTLLVANLLLVWLVWSQCSSPELSLWRGLCVISDSMASGCANVTVLYLPVLLAGVYAACVSFAAVGLFRGRDDSRRRFRAVVDWFERRRLNAPLNIPGRVWRDIEPPDPASLTIDPLEPESLLHAAAILDQHGEWDLAVALYHDVLRQWPEEHGRYCENCLRSIADKRQLSPVAKPPAGTVGSG